MFIIRFIYISTKEIVTSAFTFIVKYRKDILPFNQENMKLPPGDYMCESVCVCA